jgi:hypothetical protein
MPITNDDHPIRIETNPNRIRVRLGEIKATRHFSSNVNYASLGTRKKRRAAVTAARLSEFMPCKSLVSA